jgi:hypothetical protein
LPLTPTTTWQLPKPALGDAANIEQAVGPLADRLEIVLSTLHPRITSVTALPATPTNQQEIYYRYVSPDSGVDPVVWHLRYNTAYTDAYKWEVLGAGALAKNGTSSGALGGWSMNAWGTWDANDPIVSFPLFGLYNVHFGASLSVASLAGVTGASIGVAFNSSITPPAAAQIAGPPTTPMPLVWRAVVNPTSGTKQFRLSYNIAGTTGGSVTLTRNSSFLHVVPIRVG